MNEIKIEILTLSEKNISKILAQKNQIEVFLKFGEQNHILDTTPMGENEKDIFQSIGAVQILAYLVDHFEQQHTNDPTTLTMEKQMQELEENIKKESGENKQKFYYFYYQKFLEIFIAHIKSQLKLPADQRKIDENILKTSLQFAKQAQETLDQNTSQKIRLSDIEGPTTEHLPEWAIIAYNELGGSEGINYVSDLKQILTQEKKQPPPKTLEEIAAL